MILVPVAGAAAGTFWLHQDYHQPVARTGEILAAGLLLFWPALVIIVVFFIPAIIRGAIFPAHWRASYRHWHGRAGARSADIPARLERVVLAADRHRCINCRSQHYLNIDHSRPWAAGGLTCLYNLFVLCRRCNLIKSDYWLWLDGHVEYHPGNENIDVAKRILARERHHRYNVFRLWRAAWALAA